MKRLILMLVLALSAVSWAGGYGGGDGGPNNPYQIWTPQQMKIMGFYSEDWDKHFKLMANLDMSGYTGTQYTPVGDGGTPFTGIFDGNGYCISNISPYTVSDVNSKGVFGRTFNAIIKDLHIKNVYVGTRGPYAGGLVGYQISGSISNCSTTGRVSSSDFNGTSSATTGGLVGYMSGGSITNCFSFVTVGSSSSSSTYAGGLVGYQNSGSIVNCFSAGTVSSNSFIGTALAGGLVGVQAYGSIDRCYSMAEVFSGSFPNYPYAGGLVGKQVGENTEALIEKCFSTGKVTANIASSRIGGLVGFKSGSQGVINDSFWDSETSGKMTSAGGMGKTTVQMMTLSTFTGAGWDFSDGDGDPKDWMMLREGEDYPRLAWQTVWGGDVAGLYGVDMVDFVYLANYWGLNCGAGDCGRADIDGSGDVGIGDLVSVAEEWLVGG